METTAMPAAASVQKQQGLNQVVINKVQRMIEGRQGGVMDTINRLLSEGRIAQDFGEDGHSRQIPARAFRRGCLAETVVRHHPERAFGMDRAYTGTDTGGRNGSPGRIVGLLPSAELGGYPDRFHP